MKFSIKDFFSKCDKILGFLRIWSRLLKKFLMENFIFCAVIKLHEFQQYWQPPHNDLPLHGIMGKFQCLSLWFRERKDNDGSNINEVIKKF